MSAPAARDWRLPKSNRGYSASQCKRCGSARVAWVEQISTGRMYLCPTEPIPGRALTRKLLGDIRHDCKDPAAGGYERCERCGRHHRQPNCHLYPKAPWSRA